MSDVHLDHERGERIGQPEIIYGQHKSLDQILNILTQYQARNESAFVSRITETIATEACRQFPNAIYGPKSNTLTFHCGDEAPIIGKIALASGGTSDAPVIREAEATARFLGLESVCIEDVGIAGIHRLLGRLGEFKEAQVVLCAAGFEGALPSVLAGLIPQPIIGIPTSVGYGISEGGKTALHAMLCSCANGLLVVNIDNGCGAAMAAARMIRMMK